MKYLFIAILFLATHFFVNAQQQFTSSVPKAVRAMDAALKLYDARMSEKALVQVEEALAADPKFFEAHMLKANILSDLRQSKESIASYKNAIEINPDTFPNNYYSVAVEEYKEGLYADAKSHIEKFLTYPKINSTLKWRGKNLLKNCDFAVEAVKNPVPFEVINMGDSINTTNSEYFPTITADGKTFIFTRRSDVTYPNGKVHQQEDFYMSKLTPKGWSLAKPLSELNTEYGNEGASSLSPDGQYLFFVSCQDLGTPVPGARPTLGSCDIFMSKYNGRTFSGFRNLQEPINTSAKETMPSFSSDGRTLYFARRSNDPKQINNHDIMVTTIGDNFEWSAPVSVSDLINTEDDEISVFIHPDNQTLYFCTNGHPGMGGYDVFMSRKDSTGKWQKPVNLGYPINSIQDEGTFLVSPDAKTAYMSSKRTGGKGREDLFQFSLYEKVQPVPVSYMKGRVFDVDTKKSLGANFELIDLETGKVVVSSTSNEQSGEYLVTLPIGKRYALNVSKDNYLFYSENFELKNSKSSEPFIKDVPMKPIKAGESIVLKNIFFETDKFDLKDESKVELNKLVTFLTKNPKISFEISGHTDNVGTKPYNQTLSEKRAKSVYEYLLSKGITAARMTSKGFGDTKPVVENTTDKGRAQNRRTEFLVVGVN